MFSIRLGKDLEKSLHDTSCLLNVSKSKLVKKLSKNICLIKRITLMPLRYYKTTTRATRLMKFWKNLKMSYKISFSETSLKQLRKLNGLARKRILSYISEVLAKIENPRILGKTLTGDF